MTLFSNINVFRCILQQYWFTTYHPWFINWLLIWISKIFLIMVLNYFPTSWISWFWYSLVLSIIHTQSRIVHLWRWPQTSFWTCARKPLKKNRGSDPFHMTLFLKHILSCFWNYDNVLYLWSILVYLICIVFDNENYLSRCWLEQWAIFFAYFLHFKVFEAHY